MVEKKYLFLIAGIVWIIAGLNVLIVGFEAIISEFRYFKLIPMIIIFLIFYKRIFASMALRTTIRINSYTDKKPFFYFIDIKQAIIIIFMISIGIYIRNLKWNTFIGLFYPGLGAALTLTGIMLIVKFSKI